MKRTMRRGILLLCVLFPLFAWCAPVQAKPRPDFTLWGTASMNGVPMTGKHTGYTVRLEVDGKELSRYTMGSVAAYENYYVLKVPMDDDPTVMEKGREGDVAHLYINDDEIDDPVLALGVYGQTVKRNINVTVFIHRSMLDISPSFVDFGRVPVGSFSSLNIRISNTGNADLCISGAGLGENTSTEFSLASHPGRVTLIPGETLTLELSYRPLDEGEDRGVLELLIEDETEAVKNVPLSGDGVF